MTQERLEPGDLNKSERRLTVVCATIGAIVGGYEAMITFNDTSVTGLLGVFGALFGAGGGAAVACVIIVATLFGRDLFKKKPRPI